MCQNLQLRLVARCVAIFALALFGLDKTAFADKPVVPQQRAQVSKLRQPTAIVEESSAEPATLPPGKSLAFALDVNGKTQSGKWSVKGEVTECANGVVTLKTDSGELARFLYRLPPDQELRIRPGQAINIKRVETIVGSRLAYDLQVSSDSELMLAASHQYKQTPPKSASGASQLLSDGVGPMASISYWGDFEKKKQENATKFANIYDVPINVRFSFKAGKDERSISEGEPVVFPMDNKPYSIVVTESREVVPKPEHAGVVEGAGYSLEYVVLRGPVIAPGRKLSSPAAIIIKSP